MVKRWSVVVVVVVGCAIAGVGLIRWLGLFDIDFGETEAADEDVARSEALAADPAMAYVPEGWIARPEGPGLSPANRDFGPPFNSVLLLFDMVEPSDNIANDLLNLVEIMEDLGWTDAFSDCAHLGLDPPFNSGVFTAIKEIDGAEAQLAVSITARAGNELYEGTIGIRSPFADSTRRYSTDRSADISCLEAVR